ncbi:MAG: radical SAM family heme chaperone HemW [Candidatus Eremiobacteraeota bacterium]|nr:radical SAM family heme chaperone HemW [Candidatus Eremiobacteraeota bacterium]
MNDLTPALYMHVPYCRSRCTYCDFNAYQLNDEPSTAFSDYTDALLADIRNSPARPVSTVFWGGGTPSLMPVEHLGRLMEALDEVHPRASESEHTIEVNPGTISLAGFKEYLRLGINRLSMGAQSFEEEHLRLVGRIHTAEQIENCVELARRAGFENVSLDLIYGFPTQTLEQWRATLRRALSLEPDHLSVYQLTVEPSTRLQVQLAKGELELPDEDEMVAMDDLAEEVLAGEGFLRYEISNWARPGRECRHNLHYWADRPYLGLGCGAVSFMDGWRIERIKAPTYYQRALAEGRSPVVFAERRGSDGALKDCLMMGLRVRGGIRWSELALRFPELEKEQVMGFLERLPVDWWHADSEKFELTRRGWDFHSAVTMELMDVMFSF